ncbi:MAG: metallophosphoesterase [Clostridiales bacterium]|nr:metallophosphoesterase [Clostridiales bacterium]
MAVRGSKPLFAPGKKRRPGCLLAALLLPLLLAAVLGLNALNNSYVSLDTQSVTVPALPKALENFSILHLSDLHAAWFGENQQRMGQLLRLERYQAVCLTGDMVGRTGNVQPLLALIDLFPNDVPVFLIPGDDDPPPLHHQSQEGDGIRADYIVKAQEHGAIYLDSPHLVERDGGRVWFCPAGLYTTDLRAARFALEERQQDLLTSAEGQTDKGRNALAAVRYQLEALVRTDAAREQMQPGDFTVLLSHFPLDADDIINLHQAEGDGRKMPSFPGTVALILSGHWNNGQWRLPLIGPLWLPGGRTGLDGWLPDPQAVSGLATVHGVPQYISPGLGASGAYPWQPFRLFNRPTVTLLKLTSRLF